VSYYVEATNQGGVNSSPTYDFYVGTRVLVYDQDFEGGDGGYTHGTTGPQDDWQYGTPMGNGGDPGFAASGSNCWANDLGAPGWNGTYANNTNNFLDSPAIPTGGVQGLKLRFSRWLTVEDGQFRFWIEIPLALGTVGGITKLHPMVRWALTLLGEPDARELMGIIAASGLAQNFGALASLVTTGIQKGHMKMHLMNIMNSLGANETEKTQIIEHFKSDTVSVSGVTKVLEGLRG